MESKPNESATENEFDRFVENLAHSVYRLSERRIGGLIILENQDVLKKVKILKTEVEKTTEKHKTPWINQWTLHTVEIQETQSDEIAKDLSVSLDSKHNWYADFKNNDFH